MLDSDKSSILNKQIASEDFKNSQLESYLNSQKFVYRGVSKAEYDNIIKTGKIEKLDNGLQDVIFATHDPNKASKWGDVVLKLDRQKLGTDVKSFKYTAFGSSQNFKTGLYARGQEMNHLSVGIKSGVSSDVIAGIFE